MDDSNKAKNGCLKYFKIKLSTLDMICCFLSELIGTGLLVFLGCMGCVQTEAWPNTQLQMTLNFGLVVMIIIQSFGCVSGAHLNPTITVAAYVYNLLSLPMVGVYIAAQCLGAFMGYGLLKILLTPEAIMPSGAAHGLCVNTTHADLTILQGFAIEFVITVVLTLACCGVWDPRNAKYQDSVPLRFGLAIACIACTAGPFTGASMNPARSFAPALWNYDFDGHWIYWAAPPSSAVITALAYKAVFRREIADEKANNKLHPREEVLLS